MQRREFFGTAAVALLGACATTRLETETMEEAYGLIGQMLTAEGKRGEVIAALLEGTANMPGNLAYIIAEDLENPNAIWITEVWATKSDHASSLQLPQVQAAISRAREHITGFGTRVETRPVNSN